LRIQEYLRTDVEDTTVRAGTRVESESSQAERGPVAIVTVEIVAREFRKADAAREPKRVFIKDDDIQVERPYTPLEGVDEDGRMLFWIKQYEKGEVGRWLHSKKVGDTIEIRGPLKTWAWQDDTWDDVVMVRSFHC